MENIVIGIVLRKRKIDKKEYRVVEENNFRYLEGKCNYRGIIGDIDNLEKELELCDGIIIPGGTEIEDYHFRIVDYCKRKNIPVLGICMGCQILGLSSFKGRDQDLVLVDNHNDSNHEIIVKEDSVLRKILGKKIMVNSRHNYVLPKEKLKPKIGALSKEGYIESVEDINKDYFLLGLEWHPEDMDNMDNLYNYYLKEVLTRKIHKN